MVIDTYKIYTFVFAITNNVSITFAHQHEIAITDGVVKIAKKLVRCRSVYFRTGKKGSLLHCYDNDNYYKKFRP